MNESEADLRTYGVYLTGRKCVEAAHLVAAALFEEGGQYLGLLGYRCSVRDGRYGCTAE